MAGIDFMTIAAWLGHKDGGILVGKIYRHLLDDHGKKRLGRCASILSLWRRLSPPRLPPQKGCAVARFDAGTDFTRGGQAMTGELMERDFAPRPSSFPPAL